PSRIRCPYSVGDAGTFTPSQRTRGLYQDVERFGVHIGETLVIEEIRDAMYLDSKGGIGGWPWNEFSRASYFGRPGTVVLKPFAEARFAPLPTEGVFPCGAT